jgi:hypothetical protein
MVEIRHRLALPDSDLLGYGYRQPRFAPDQGRSFSAIDLACPTCRAEPGSACVTGRMSSGRHPVPLLCPDRIELARQAVAEGMLDSRGPAAPVRPAPCPGCRSRKQGGRALPCTIEHQCSRYTADARCKFAAEPGSDLCTHHRGVWVRNSVRAPAPESFQQEGRRHKKLSDQDRADIVRKHAAGAKFAELAREYEVAPTSIKYVLKKAGAR